MSSCSSSIVTFKSREYFHASRGSTLREEFKKYIEPFVADVSKYGTHSMKSGAASIPRLEPLAGAYRAIYWTCMLGGDVLPRRTDTLIKHTIKDRLSVSKSLLL